MTIHTLQDLAYAYNVADPVREMLFALQDRIDELEAQRKPLTDEMRKQMKEASDNMEMRGAFANGWLSAEAAHGIKEGT